MQELAAKRPKPLSPLLKLSGGRFRVQLLALVDQRINHIRLSAGLEFFSHEDQDFRQFLAVAHCRDDLPATRRHLVDDRNIEVAKHGHRERARNRRRRHDKNVRRRLARRQPRALGDAELVLLIDHRQPEVLERHPFIQKGVRPDDDMRATVRPEVDLRSSQWRNAIASTLQARVPQRLIRPCKQRQRFVLPRARSQRDPHPERLEPATKNGVMLLG